MKDWKDNICGVAVGVLDYGPNFGVKSRKEYTIVTFDSDFFDLNTLYGFPPKIIWIRTGNTTTKNLEIIFKDKFELIKLFIEEDYGCLEIID